MKIKPRIIRDVAWSMLMSDKRLAESNGCKMSKLSTGMFLGKILAAKELSKPSIESLGRANEAGFLACNYMMRHNLFWS